MPSAATGLAGLGGVAAGAAALGSGGGFLSALSSLGPSSAPATSKSGDISSGLNDSGSGLSYNAGGGISTGVVAIIAVAAVAVLFLLKKK